jgi:hypothetical protein
MRFTPPLRANSELGDTLEPFLWQSDLQETTSSHIITHSHQQRFTSVNQSLLLLLDFETNCCGQQKSTKINRQQRESQQQQKNQFCDRDRKVVGQVRTANLSGMFIEMHLRNSHT